MASYPGPSDLCRDLNLLPEPGQVELMERLADRQGLADERLRLDEDGGETLRAALMVVLWRVLRVPGTRGTILAPSEGDSLACGEVGRTAAAFLAEVCKTRDEGLRQSTRVSTWNHLEFGSQVGWEIRIVPNVPAYAAEAARRSSVGLVLDAGNPQKALAEASRAFEAAFDVETGVLIRLW